MHAELQDLLPGIINQLGPDNLSHLKKIAQQVRNCALVLARSMCSFCITSLTPDSCDCTVFLNLSTSVEVTSPNTDSLHSLHIENAGINKTSVTLSLAAAILRVSYPVGCACESYKHSSCSHLLSQTPICCADGGHMYIGLPSSGALTVWKTLRS